MLIFRFEKTKLKTTCLVRVFVLCSLLLIKNHRHEREQFLQKKSGCDNSLYYIIYIFSLLGGISNDVRKYISCLHAIYQICEYTYEKINIEIGRDICYIQKYAILLCFLKNVHTCSLKVRLKFKKNFKNHLFGGGIMAIIQSLITYNFSNDLQIYSISN